MNMRFTFKAEPKDGTKFSVRYNDDGLTLTLTLTLTVTVDRGELVEFQPLQEVTNDFVVPLTNGGDAGKAGATVGKIMDAVNILSPDA